MEIEPIQPNHVPTHKFESFEQAKSLRDNLVWQQLDKVTVEEALIYWLTTLGAKTKLNYQSGMRKLAVLGLIDPSITLQSFALLNHDTIRGRFRIYKKSYAKT